MPSAFREFVELGSITIRAKPLMDAEELVAVCHRCQSKNPMLQGDGSECVNCKQPFVFSSHTCEVLPLIEFYLDPDISDVEAVRLIQYVTLSGQLVFTLTIES